MKAEVRIHHAARLNGEKEAIKGAVLGVYQRDGILTPSALIKAAKPKKSPLHNEFTWDGNEALQKIQRQEALYLIRVVSLDITEVKTDKVYRGREFVLRPGTFEDYVSIRTELSDAELRDQMVEQLMLRLESLRQELEDFEEFTEVVQAITKVRKKAA